MKVLLFLIFFCSLCTDFFSSIFSKTCFINFSNDSSRIVNKNPSGILKKIPLEIYAGIIAEIHLCISSEMSPEILPDFFLGECILGFLLKSKEESSKKFFKIFFRNFIKNLKLFLNSPPMFLFERTSEIFQY